MKVTVVQLLTVVSTLVSLASAVSLRAKHPRQLSGSTPTAAPTAGAVYASEVCIENAGTFNLKFRIDDLTNGEDVSNGYTDYYGWASTKTKCRKVTGVVTPGDSLRVKMEVQSGPTKYMTPLLTYSAVGPAVTYKCKGHVDSPNCYCYKNCGPITPTAAPTAACLNPVMSDVQTFNQRFSPNGYLTATTNCDNSKSPDGTTLQCGGTFVVSNQKTTTIDVQNSIGITETEKITMKESVIIESVTVEDSISAGYTFTEGHSQSESQTTSMQTQCTTTVAPHSCSNLYIQVEYGTLVADYTATITCGDGSAQAVKGTMNVAGMVSEALETSCRNEQCPAQTLYH